MESDGRTPFVSFDHLDADGSITSVYRLAPVVDALTVQGLKVSLVRDSDTRYNVSDLLAKLAAARAAKLAGEGARFSVSNIRLAGARIDFDDRPKGAKHVVSDINVAVPSISNLPGHLAEYVKPAFAAKVNGAPLHFEGETLPFENSLRTHIAIDFDSLDVPRYVEYSPAALPVKIDGGKLDREAFRALHRGRGAGSVDRCRRNAGASGAQGFRPRRRARGQNPRRPVASTSPSRRSTPSRGSRKITVRLKLRDRWPGPTWPWQVASIEAREIRVDARQKRVDVASLSSGGGAIDVTRDREGIALPLRLPKGDAAASEAPAPWTIALAKAMALDGYRVTLHDETVHDRAHLVQRVDVAHLEAADLSTAKGAKSTASARLALANSGSIEAQGAFSLSPFQLEAKVDARHVDIVPARRYVDEFKTVALKSGFASARGTLSVRGEGDAMRLAYDGTAAVTKVVSIDTSIDEHLLDWDAVRLSGVALKWAPNDPLNLAIADIAVDKIYSRIVVNPDGKLNLQQLKVATPEEPAAPAPAPADVRPRNVRIDRITFTASRLDFTDHFIRPNYAADVGDLSGTVTNLSSDPASRGQVDLKGSYDQTSPVTIAGTVNPLSGDLFVDIAAKGKDIELPKLSAYSVRYAGYGITKGRLTLDVKYHIEHGKLEGRNRIFLDQLTFGEHVDGPDATKLPVLFAVNLLKNSKGEIDLELPISGSLDDPQFEVGALVSGSSRTSSNGPSRRLSRCSRRPRGATQAPRWPPGTRTWPSSTSRRAATIFPRRGERSSTPSRRLLEAVPQVRIEIAPDWDPAKDGDALDACACCGAPKVEAGCAEAVECAARGRQAARRGRVKPPPAGGCTSTSQATARRPRRSRHQAPRLGRR